MFVCLADVSLDSAMGAHSVAYGLAFHYLFIAGGYGVRAGQDSSVLFLDVFRNAIYVVVPVAFIALVGLVDIYGLV